MQISTLRTENDYLQDFNFGPCIEQSEVKNYQKNSPSKNSISSESIQRHNQSPKAIISRLKKQLTTKNQNIYLNQNTNLKESRRYLIDGKQKEETFNFLKTIIKSNLVNRFKNNLLSSSYVIPQNLKQILEKEDYQQEQKDKGKSINQIRQQIYNWQEKKLINLLMPDRNFILMWDLISLFLLFLSLFLSLLIISFGQHFQCLQIFINFYILLEFLFSIYRPIIINGEVVIEIQQIWNNYFKTQFLEDVISFTIWFLIYFEFDKKPILNEVMAIILFLIIIRKINRKYNILIEQLYLKGFNRNILNILSLIIIIFFFAHTMACLWHHVGNLTQNYGSWLSYYNVLDENIWVRYNYSFYWATMTMVTVGYGDITPKNQIEIAFATIIMLFSSCMFAYSMNSIGVIVKTIYDQQTKFKRTLILMNQFMSKNEINEQIQRRVKNYIKFNIENHVLENQQETTKIINELPLNLQKQIEQEIQYKVMQKIKVINDNFQISTQSRLRSILVEIKFTPNDYIYHRNDQKDNFLYFIKEGEVQIIEEQSQKIIKVLKAGETFGEFQFFTGQNTRESVTSVGFTQLYKINREQFLTIIQNNQKDFERFHKIKDSILYSKSFSAIQIKCQICGQSSHLQIECPFMTYQPNLYLKILKMNYSQINNRFYQKRQNQKIHSLMILFQNQQVVKQIQDDYIDSFNTEHLVSYKEANSLSYLQGCEQISDKIVISNKSFPKQEYIKGTNTNGEIKYCDQLYLKIVESEKQNQSQIHIHNKPSLIDNERRKMTIKEPLIFQQLDQFQGQFNQNELKGFDKFHNFTEYLPHNNFNYIIKQLYKEKYKLKITKYLRKQFSKREY